MPDYSIGKTVLYAQREAELDRCGVMERPRRSNPGSNFAFANPWCRCDCESELKMEIPAKWCF